MLGKNRSRVRQNMALAALLEGLIGGQRCSLLLAASWQAGVEPHTPHAACTHSRSPHGAALPSAALLRAAR